MREALRKPLGVPCLLAFGVLVAVILAGCAQNGGGEGQPSDETTVAEGGMTTPQEETTAGQQTTTQRTQDGEQEDTAQDQEQAQQQEDAREEPPSSDQPPGEQQAIAVRITGTEGIAFAGRVGTAQERRRRVEGSVPEEYEITFEGAAVTAAVRKQEPQEGTLGVEVVRDGRVVASRESSTATGVVNVVWTPRQQQGN